MNKVTRRHLRFYSPGSFVSNDTTVEVKHFGSPHLVEWPSNAYSFQQIERVDAEDIDGTVYHGETKNIGPQYFRPGSRKVLLEDIPDTEKNSTLLWNMRVNDWAAVIYTKSGQAFPFEEGKTEIIE